MFRALRSSLRPNRTAAARSRRASLAVESLEGRQLLSTTSVLGSDGVLTINADNNPNKVSVTFDLVKGLVVHTTSGRVIDKQQPFLLGQVKSIVFNGGTAANSFTNSTSIPARINGHGAGDVLTAGFSGDVITEDSPSATINGDIFGTTTFATTSDLFFTVTDSGLTSFDRSYTFNNRVRNVVLNLAGPLASKGGGHVDLTGYAGKATVNSQGVVRTDYFLGNGPTTVNGGTGLNVVNVNNVTAGRFAGNVFSVNGVGDTLNNVTNLNVTSAGGVSNIDLNGFNGNTFVNIAKAGNATVRGGSGANTVVSTAGTNVVLPSAGRDFVSGSNVTRIAPAAASVSAAQRNVTGGPAVVYLEPNGTTLDVVGPTGAGFSLQGNWAVATAANGQQTFTATGTVVLHAAAGDFTLNASPSSPATVTARGGFLGFGTLVGASLTGLTVNTSDPSSPLNRLESTFGLHVDSSGATWNLVLGKDVTGVSPMPVEGAVPYLVANVTAGTNVSFATKSVAASPTRPLTLLIDPSDPSLSVQSVNAGKVDFQVAASARGNIQFTPTQTAPVNTTFFGNLYTNGVDAGSIDFGDRLAAASGATVIDFDVNQTTNLANVNPDVVRKLVSGQSTVQQAFPGGNVAVGVNGVFRAGFTGFVTPATAGPRPDYDFTLTSPAGSVLYKDGGVTFATAGANFESGYQSLRPTRLGYLGASVSGVTGTIGNDTTPIFQAQANLKFTGSLGAFLPAGATMTLNNDARTPAVTVAGTSLSFPGFGKFQAKGTVSPGGDLVIGGDGSTTLTQKDGRQIVGQTQFFGSNIVPPYQIPLPGRFNLSFNGNPDSLAPPTANVSMFVSQWNFPKYGAGDGSFRTENGSLRASMEANFDSLTSKVSYTSHGKITGHRLSVLAAGNVVYDGPFTEDFSIDDSGAAINEQVVFFPNTAIATTSTEHLFGFSLSGAAFPGVKVTPKAGPNGRVVVTGRVSVPDPKSTWTLRVNWGDGTPVQTLVLPPGNNGRRVNLPHRYLQPSPAGKPYQVTLSWEDDKGRGHTKALSVRFPAGR